VIARAADPYRDLDVIDTRAPRDNQAVIGVLSPVAVEAYELGRRLTGRPFVSCPIPPRPMTHARS
jgi:hypothetical protein